MRCTDYGVRPSRCGPFGANFPERPTSGSPGSRAGGFHACERSQTTQGRATLAMTRRLVLPSAFLHSVGTLEHQHFAAQYSARVFPCQRFAGTLADTVGMAEEQWAGLLLDDPSVDVRKRCQLCRKGQARWPATDNQDVDFRRKMPRQAQAIPALTHLPWRV